MLQKNDALQALRILEGAPRVRCICHRNPDGDAIGSLLGMGLLVEKLFPEKEVTMLCTDPVPETFCFLPGALRVQCPPTLEIPNPTSQIPKNSQSPAFVQATAGKPISNLQSPVVSDVIIFLDSAEPKLTEMHETHPQFFDGTFKTINIDHHPTNTNFATINFVLPSASSACEVIVRLGEALNWAMTSDIATCLLTGIYTDTGGLLHSNATAEVYRAVAQLLRSGARRQEVIEHVYRTAKLSTLKLWGRVLEKISVSEEGGAVSAVTEGDFRATGADYSELTGAIDFVNAVPGVRFSMVLSERGGKVKGSLRTLRDDVDVAAMASTFDGGGHRKAAGFALSGTLRPEVRWKVVEESAEVDKKEDRKN